MRILIASGGSGGHIFPAIALAKELCREKDAEIIFVASRRRLDKSILEESEFKKIYLSANPMPFRFGWRFFVFLAKLFFDSICSVYILVRYRPDICVGFGGYTAGAILFLASHTSIKTVIHEQNLVPGRTNRFLDKYADIVAVSFADTQKYFRNKNVKFTGNPLREGSLRNSPAKGFVNFGLDGKKTTILVMGGSQGARSLNKLVSGAFVSLPAEIKAKMQALHITGGMDAEFITELYRKNDIAGKVFSFIKNINEAYSVCDFAVSRAGAAAIFELACFGKPMILIPYPNPKNNQRLNAEYFAQKGAAIYKDEKSVSKKELMDSIINLVQNVEKRALLAENALKLAVPDGAARLKKEIMGLLKARNSV